MKYLETRRYPTPFDDGIYFRNPEIGIGCGRRLAGDEPNETQRALCAMLQPEFSLGAPVADSPSSSAPDETGADAAVTAVAAPRSNFVTTPLFLPALAVDSSGERTVTWTLPDNTGAFELAAYAAAQMPPPRCHPDSAEMPPGCGDAAEARSLPPTHGRPLS